MGAVEAEGAKAARGDGRLAVAPLPGSAQLRLHHLWLGAAGTRLLAPLVARAGGSVTLSAADLGRPWSLSVLELPGGDVTLVAVALEEQEDAT